jgi:hypothetical protein
MYDWIYEHDFKSIETGNYVCAFDWFTTMLVIVTYLTHNVISKAIDIMIVT